MKLSLFLFVVLSILSLFVGSVHLSAEDVWLALCGGGDEMARFVVVDTRLPQMLTAVLAGSALAVSGLVMQTLFSNPLADPSLLGVNSGASLGAALSLLLFGGGWTAVGVSLSSALLTVVCAFAGSCVVIALLTVCSRLLRGNLELLVTGVMLSFILSALISLLSFYATADGVHSFVVWGLGNFSGVPLSRVPLMALLVVLPCLLIGLFANQLNALLLGEDYTRNLGVNVQRTRTVLLLLTGLLTAAVTALCGPISFVGLAVPHIARLVLRTANHRRLLPVCLVMGANVALLSLIVSQIPGERGTLPLAAITPLFGVPVVAYILLRK